MMRQYNHHDLVAESLGFHADRSDNTQRRYSYTDPEHLVHNVTVYYDERGMSEKAIYSTFGGTSQVIEDQGAVTVVYITDLLIDITRAHPRPRQGRRHDQWSRSHPTEPVRIPKPLKDHTHDPAICESCIAEEQAYEEVARYEEYMRWAIPSYAYQMAFAENSANNIRDFGFVPHNGRRTPEQTRHFDSVFWRDLAKDLEDPEFRTLYQAESLRIQEYDRKRNEENL